MVVHPALLTTAERVRELEAQVERLEAEVAALKAKAFVDTRIARGAP